MPRSRVPSTAPPRNGFALLTVLWVLVGAASVTMMITLDARSVTQGGRNRLLSERAYWTAFGCAELVRSAIDQTLANARDEPARRLAWIELEARLVSARAVEAPCTLRLEAVGSRVTLSDLSEDRLRILFGAVRGAADADALAAAAMDWIDADDRERPNGAERSWYEARGRLPPRNGPLGAPDEVALIRGFEGLSPVLGPLLSTESTPIAINNAPRAVLATVRGFTDELVERLLSLRAAGAPVLDHRELTTGLSEPAAASVLLHFAEITARTTVDPAAWSIMVAASAGVPAVASHVEVRVARGVTHTVVVARRVW